jgi:hypothetical protein
MNVFKLFPLAEKVGRFLTTIPDALLTGVGLILMAGALVLGAIIHEKDVAVAATFGGTLIGSVLLSLFLPKLIYTAKAQEMQDILKVKKHLEEAHENERKRLEAVQEIARLESMRVNVDMISSTANLSLLEIETTLTDFQRCVLGPPTPASWLKNSSRSVYLGAVQVPVKAQLGIDLRQIRVREDQIGKHLFIGPLVMTNVVDTLDGAKWLLDQVQTEVLKDGEPIQFKGEIKDSLLKDQSRQQEQQLRARLKQGLDFKAYEAGVRHAAERILRTLLAPLNRQVVFEPTPIDDGQPLLTYLAEREKQRERAILRLRNLDATRALPEGTEENT